MIHPCLTFLLVAAADAAAPPPAAVTFDGALGLAASMPRVVAGEQAAREKVEGDRQISSVPFNPQVTVQPGWRFAPADARQPELIAEIVQPWNLSGQSGARRRAVRIEEEVLHAQARVAAIDARFVAARAWIDLWAAEHALEETRREEAIAGELERLVSRAAALGAMTRADVAEARGYHAEARAAALAAEGELFTRGATLSREIGARDQTPLRTAGPLPDPPVPDEAQLPAFLERAATLPLLVARELQAQGVRAREIEERAARGTVAQFGAVVQRDAPGGLVVSGLARMTFPMFDRGERERAAMRAEAARLDGERQDALLGARADLIAGFHEVEHTAAMFGIVRDDLAPASREAAETRRRIFENGGATLLEVLQSDRAAVAAARRLWQAEAEQAWSRTKLWLLVAELSLVETRT